METQLSKFEDFKVRFDLAEVEGQPGNRPAETWQRIILNLGLLMLHCGSELRHSAESENYAVILDKAFISNLLDIKILLNEIGAIENMEQIEKLENELFNT
jgi:hypothetical protein